MRQKILIPEREDFKQVVREINQSTSIHLQSERRRFITTEDLPEEIHADLKERGMVIIPDERYDIEPG